MYKWSQIKETQVKGISGVDNGHQAMSANGDFIYISSGTRFNQ